MIYRIVAESQQYGSVDAPGDFGQPATLAGAWMAGLPTDRWEGLRMPLLENPRVRFWFTQAGWHRFGAPLAAYARDEGIVVQVLRRKNPAPSSVFYRDQYQVALLPDRSSD